MSNPTESLIRNILKELRAGNLTMTAATRRLIELPIEQTAFARLDHHRAVRQGIPEAILCTGKRLEQVCDLLMRLERRGDVALATRVPEAWGEELEVRFRRGRWQREAGLFALLPKGYRRPRGQARVVVASAGTADVPVAEEAAWTVEAYGFAVARLFDVGVAGLHRLLAEADVLRRARVIIVVAGMDGALPSVVGGMVRAPVVAVPTSVGYGASLGGIAALLTMLNSCAPGVTTVNIDNGYGAAVAACKMLQVK